VKTISSSVRVDILLKAIILTVFIFSSPNYLWAIDDISGSKPDESDEVAIDENPSDDCEDEDAAGPKVKVKGRRLLVDFDGNGKYQRYFIKGAAYSPHPIGTFPSQFGTCRYLGTDEVSQTDQFSCEGEGEPYFYNRQDILDRDFNPDLPSLVTLGVNTIRIWNGFTNDLLTDEPAFQLKALLDKAEAGGIKVIMGFWVDYGLNFSDPLVRDDVMDRFERYVQAYKDHPAVLFWAVGNENNFFLGNNSPGDWYSLANELAQKAKSIESANYHPVAIVNGDLGFIGDSLSGAVDDQLDSIDIWGVNVYRGGLGFNHLFKEYSQKSKKPLWVSEFGVDAYDMQKNSIDERTQARLDKRLWQRIREHSHVTIGATVMAYSDEWWIDNGQWNSSAATHNIGGGPGGVQDGFVNEEWWGIMGVEDNGDGPDQFIPRDVFCALRRGFTVKGQGAHYRGPENAQSCDETWACCPEDKGFAKDGRCVKKCTPKSKL